MTEKYILVVDDEPKMRRVLEIMLQKLGHRVFTAANGHEAVDIIQGNTVDLMITDLRMTEMDGIALLTHLRANDFDMPVIVVTAHGTIETAIDAMKQGACDYILRPFDLATVELAVKRALGSLEVARQNTFLRQEVNRGWDAFIGISAPMKGVYELIQRVGPTKTSVMITGETGTGKELAARAIHNASPRCDHLFVPINCAAIPAEILESELFGYEKGAFTGALRLRIGKFELANEGTLFLDELTEMPIALQAKLLRVLQENTIERLGGNRAIPLDIRIIAATNNAPREAILQGKLREDLYYRVNVFAINLPPLRDRKDDIPSLVTHLIAKHNPRHSKDSLPDHEVITRLQAYSWPGNVRELENVVERALVLSGNGALKLKHFPLETDIIPQPVQRADSITSPTITTLNQAVEELETRMIEDALASVDGNKAKAAALLDISERKLWYKLKKYRPQLDD